MSRSERNWRGNFRKYKSIRISKIEQVKKLEGVLKSSAPKNF
jgi:hypothetical protein